MRRQSPLTSPRHARHAVVDVRLGADQAVWSRHTAAQHAVVATISWKDTNVRGEDTHVGR
jgi:hypothetical protein